MKKTNLFVDDLRALPKGFDILARTAKEGLTILLTHDIGTLSLDYDLGVTNANGDLAPDGYALVQAMASIGASCDRIEFHTDNVIGFRNMKEYLVSAQKNGAFPKHTDIAQYKTESRYLYPDGIPYKETMDMSAVQPCPYTDVRKRVSNLIMEKLDLGLKEFGESNLDYPSLVSLNNFLTEYLKEFLGNGANKGILDEDEVKKLITDWLNPPAELNEEQEKALGTLAARYENLAHLDYENLVADSIFDFLDAHEDKPLNGDEEVTAVILAFFRRVKEIQANEQY